MRMLVLALSVAATLTAVACAPAVSVGAPLLRAPPACAPSADAPALGVGVLDVRAPVTYRASVPLETSPATLMVDTVQVFFEHESRDGEFLTDSELPHTGDQPRSVALGEPLVGGSVLTFDLVTPSEAVALSRDPAMAPIHTSPDVTSRVHAFVQAIATSLPSGPVASDWMKVKLDVCDGCLVADTCVADDGSLKEDGRACDVGQDFATACE